MPDIAFLGGTFSSRSKNIDCQRTINFYPELNQQDSKSIISLIGTPGCSLFTTAPALVRGWHVFNNLLFVVAGNGLYSINSAGVVSASLGTLSTSSGRVSMQNNGLASAGVGGNQLIIVDGSAGYIYDVSTSTFSNIATTGGFPTTGASQVSYIDGYFVLIQSGTMNAFCSDLYDGLTWNALATNPISGAPDSLNGVINSHQQLWFIKDYTSEVWYDAGTATSSGFPFSRVPGAIIDYGTPSPWAITRASNTIFFIATERNNEVGEFVGIVALNGYQPQVISPPPINYQISQMSVISDAFSYSYSEGGHTFVVFTFPTGNATYVYDTTTKMWHERSFYAGTGMYAIGRHLGDNYCLFNNRHYISDYRSGAIYELSSAYFDDSGTPIVSTRIAQHLADKNDFDPVFFSRIQVDLEAGTGSSFAGPNKVSCTISIANPAIISATGHGFSINQPVVFTTTGTLPTGLSLNTAYYIIAAGFTLNQFEVSATLGGAAVTTSGTQSGTQTVSICLDPQAFLSWSDDGGYTWSSDYPASMGKLGNYKTRAIWRRLGYARDRVFRVSMAHPVKKIIIGAKVE